MKEYVFRTSLGTVKGYEDGNNLFFKGIPYATANRFEKPVLIEKWDNEIDATQDEINAYQFSSFYDESTNGKTFYYREFRSNKIFRYAENPITLSIVTPKNASNLPVVVFIHGGGFETGNVGEYPYGDSTEYAKRGIILVNISYRLGVFALYKGLNLGLFDIDCALKWVKKYIKDFGGDPERITAMGQSAGGMSLQDLLLTQRLNGIIKGAIMMSSAGIIPGIIGPSDKKKTEKIWNQVRIDAGAKDDEELKTVDVKVLFDAWMKNVHGKHGSLLASEPQIDGEIIPEKMQICVKENADLDIPILVGITAEDMFPPLLIHMATSLGLSADKRRHAPVYGYFFSRPLPGDDMKSFHACDLWYMFGNMDKSWRPFEKIDFNLSKEMIDYAANFIKNGNPNEEGKNDWPSITFKSRFYRRFDGDKEGLISHNECKKILWHSFFYEKQLI